MAFQATLVMTIARLQVEAFGDAFRADAIQEALAPVMLLVTGRPTDACVPRVE